MPPSRLVLGPTGQRFAVTLPHGWLAQDGGPQGALAVFQRPSQHPWFRSNVSVTTQSLGGLNASEYLQLSRLQLKQLAVSWQEEDTVQIEGVTPKLYFQWTLRNGNMELRYRQAIVIREKAVYLITAVAASDEFPQLAADFVQVLSSFELETNTGR